LARELEIRFIVVAGIGFERHIIASVNTAIDGDDFTFDTLIA